MKKKVLAAAIAFAALFGANVNAETGNVQFGVKGGVNVSNFTGDLDGIKSKAGFQLGLTLDYELAPSVYLISGLEYIVKGSKEKGSGDLMSMNLGYIQLPVHIGYKVPVSEATKLLLHAGPYVAYAAKGTLKEGGASVDWFDKKYNLETTFFVPKRFDAGLGLGVGLEFGKVSVGLDVDYGLVNIYKNSGASIKNLSSGLSVGYKF